MPEETRILAGGMSLVPRLVRRIERPRRLVDIGRVSELRGIDASAKGLTIGAAVTQREVEQSSLLPEFGLLAQALPRVGVVPTRNRGTVCGSIAHANPAAELGVCLLALGGQVTAVSASGSRAIGADDFFVGPHRTALRADELLREVTFDRPESDSIGYFDEVTLRGAGDTPLVCGALVCRTDNGLLVDLRVVVGGAGQEPLVLRPPDATLDLKAVDTLLSVLKFADDPHCTGEHRQRLANRLVTRLLQRLRQDFS
jgi:CO/xanthine dehydrogenase FAD-binding subunit